MRFLQRCLVPVCVLATVLSARGEGQPGDPVPGRYIVMLRDAADPLDVPLRNGVMPRSLYRKAFRGFAGAVSPGALRALEADPDVVSVIPDRIVTIVAKPDGRPGKGNEPADGGTTAPQVVPAGVERVGGGPFAKGPLGAGIGVAVVDTGLDFEHTDLIVGAASFTAHGRTAEDDNGHGTHVGGIVGATMNDRDVVGVAPKATLYAVKVLNRKGSGSDADILDGLEWVLESATAVTPPIRVVNMSLGRPGTLGDNPALEAGVEALTDADISVVVAAGNDYETEVRQHVPACYPWVISVASTTALAGTSNSAIYGPVQADTASFFTTDGPGVTISAPGEEREDIVFPSIRSIGILSTARGGGTTRMSGTSMAAPHVAGVVALMLEAQSQLSPEEVKTKLVGSAAGKGEAPYIYPASGQTFDGICEGIANAPAAIAWPKEPAAVP